MRAASEAEQAAGCRESLGPFLTRIDQAARRLLPTFTQSA